MPRTIARDLHVRLSVRAYDTLKDLEDISGFSGSRLIEESILAINDIIENFAQFQAISEEKTTKEFTLAFSSFQTAMETVLSRLGYDVYYEAFSKEYKKAIAKEESTGRSDEKKAKQER